MAQTTRRRIAIITAAILTTALTACSNPMAPSAKKTQTSQPAALETGYQGAIG